MASKTDRKASTGQWLQEECEYPDKVQSCPVQDSPGDINISMQQRTQASLMGTWVPMGNSYCSGAWLCSTSVANSSTLNG